MARKKHSVRFAAKTLLIYGEGKTERAFLNFLKSTFVERNSGIRITIDSGNGGGPAELIQKVSGKLMRRKFDACVVMMDGDLPWPDSRPRKVNGTPIHYICSNPCIEGLFLKLLNYPKFHSIQHSSDKCKRLFHKDYLQKKRKYDKESYNKIFDRKMLLEKSLTVPELASLLQSMGVTLPPDV